MQSSVVFPDVANEDGCSVPRLESKLAGTNVQKVETQFQFHDTLFWRVAVMLLHFSIMTLIYNTSVDQDRVITNAVARVPGVGWLPSPSAQTGEGRDESSPTQSGLVFSSLRHCPIKQAEGTPANQFCLGSDGS